MSVSPNFASKYLQTPKSQKSTFCFILILKISSFRPYITINVLTKYYFSDILYFLPLAGSLCNGLDLGKLVGLIFIDLKKAFDTVDHDILCKKLAHYGVQHRELSWFKSYLTNRKQFCRVNIVDSDFGYIEFGVPQGSCLGPLLFRIYINDLPQAVRDSTVSVFADDTSVCHQSNDLTQLTEASNNDLRQLDTWL